MGNSPGPAHCGSLGSRGQEVEKQGFKGLQKQEKTATDGNVPQTTDPGDLKMAQMFDFAYLRGWKGHVSVMLIL